MCARSSVDRVPGYEPVGRGFESPRARHKKAKSKIDLAFLTKFALQASEIALL